MAQLRQLPPPGVPGALEHRGSEGRGTDHRVLLGRSVDRGHRGRPHRLLDQEELGHEARDLRPAR